MNFKFYIHLESKIYVYAVAQDTIRGYLTTDFRFG